MTNQRLKVRARIGRTPRPNQAATTPQTDSDVINEAINLAGATVELYRITWTVRLPECPVLHGLTGPDHKCPPPREEGRSGYAWRCLGCDATSHEYDTFNDGYEETRPRESRTAANDHAASCRYAPKHPRPTDQDRTATALDIHSQHLAVLLVGLPSVLLLLILVAGLTELLA